MKPTAIVISGITSILERFLRPLAATAGSFDDPLALTIGERKPSTSRPTQSRKGIDISGIPESEIPW